MLRLPTAYFPSIFQFSLQVQHPFLIDATEHFEKQTYRNRAEILTANGPLKLSIPLKKWRNHTPVQEIEISYDENWAAHHWKSILSAYSASPYLEFYQDDLKPLLFTQTPSLLEYNTMLQKELYALLSIKGSFNFAEEYVEQEVDWRKLISPKNKELKQVLSFKKYNQVFEDKFGFIANLSILDLLFNLGPQSLSYLQQLNIPEEWLKK